MPRRPWMGSLVRAVAGLFVAAVFMLGSGVVARADVHLVFGVYASDKPTAMVEQLRPILNLLEKGVSVRVGEPVKITLQVDRDYETAAANFVAGRVDFTRLGAASYVAVKDQVPDLTILAAEKYNHSKFFEGVICVNTASTIDRVSDLVGKTFAFGSEKSTIGRYLAQLYLAEHGVTESKLKSFRYLGRHDRVGTAVGSGQFDAGALEDTIFEKLVGTGVVPIRAIASFPTVTKAWVARAGLAPRIRDALVATLVAINDPKALAALRFDGFEGASDSDYDRTRTAIKKNDLFFDQPRSHS